MTEKFMRLEKTDTDKNEVIKLKNSIEKLQRILSSFHTVE
jgi:hypothetical protein